MKPILALALILGLVAGITGCAQEQAKANETVTIHVKGVQCTMCVANIEKGLAKLDGIASVSVDLDEKLATVEYVPAKLNQSQIEDAIADIGYDANETKRNEEAYEMLPACCR
jgi:mercuric ion binding protein